MKYTISLSSLALSIHRIGPRLVGAVLGYRIMGLSGKLGHGACLIWHYKVAMIWYTSLGDLKWCQNLRPNQINKHVVTADSNGSKMGNTFKNVETLSLSGGFMYSPNIVLALCLCPIVADSGRSVSKHVSIMHSVHRLSYISAVSV